MPEDLKQILVMQNWQHQLSHEIYHGILDHIAHRAPGQYVCSRLPWDAPSVWRDGHTWDVAAFIVPVLNQDKYDRIQKLGWKTISTHIGFPTPGIPQVDLDHAATGRMAAEYCLTLGNLQAAYVGISKIQALLNRKQGFLDRMEEAHREVFVYEVGVTLGVPPKGAPDINSWLSSLPKPAVIYCSDDDLALEVANRCRHQNIAVPDEVAILGTQDDPALCRECIPGLSSVHLDYHKVGYEAMALTDQWLRTRKRPPQKKEIQPSHVEVRPSTDILSLPDPNVVRAVRLLRDRCTEQPAMADIAQEAGMSLRLMQLRFKELLGHSPGEELRQARLERVKQLLRETTFGLEEIAETCGFANANTLCEQFKIQTGITPGSYRKS
jgi:LacI family transcriptional regulator